MWFFTSGAFWFVEDVLFVLAMIGLKVWMQDRRTPMPIWKWLLVGAWMLMCGFTFSVACVIVGVVVWGLLQVGRAGTNLEPWDIPGDEEA